MTEHGRRRALIARLAPLPPALALAAAGQASARLQAQSPETRHALAAPPLAAAGQAAVPAGRVAADLTAAAVADPVARWRPFVDEASRRFGLPATWIERVMRAESGGRTALNGRPIVSPAGAMGLMQLMPATWNDLRADLRLGGDPNDPRDNILAGTAYLAALYRRFGYPGLFAAYNAGPARYAAWLAGRAPLPAETRLYLARLGVGAAPDRLFADADAAAPSRPDVGTTGSARVGGASPGEPGPTDSNRLRPLRSRLFAIDRTTSTARAGSAEGRAGALFVALSDAPSRSPED
jgi:soluble lytic murein transglycosylase-like protein